MMSEMGNEKTRILVADDEFLSVMKIREILESSGYDVVGDAADGLEAVDMTASLRPDVVLMDIGMPNLDGFEASRIIQLRHPTPVVILTAYYSSEMLARANESGVDAYLMKPPDVGELERSIEVARHRFADRMRLRDLNLKLRKEIQARKKTEGELKTALDDRTDLMNELLHRTKNNMNAICSLIRLQSGGITDENVLNGYRKIENCVKSMAQVQEMLYTSGEYMNIDLESYLREIAQVVFGNYTTGRAGITLTVDLEPISVSADTAIRCGMIVNELISNAVKYAFPDNREGKIRIEIRDKKKDGIEIGVVDTGIGFSNQGKKSDTLGLNLVEGFANQMDGHVEYRPADRGAAVFVCFSPEREPETADAGPTAKR